MASGLPKASGLTDAMSEDKQTHFGFQTVAEAEKATKVA